MKKMSKREALEKCRDHWQWMADTGSNYKSDYFDENGIYAIPELDCYCCAYVSQQPDATSATAEGCEQCLLKGYAWDICCESDQNWVDVDEFEHNYSVFEEWKESLGKKGEELRKKHAAMMVYACEWALSELI